MIKGNIAEGVVVPLGPGDPAFEIPDSFFDPLLADMQRGWEG
jgi:hypothetical protein